MEADRNRDQAEGDVSAPEAWHRITPPEGAANPVPATSRLRLEEDSDELGSEGRQAPPAPSAPRRGLLARIDPGLITGASDVDPSGIATYSQVGSQFGPRRPITRSPWRCSRTSRRRSVSTPESS